jgi:hypothetical protein
VERGALLDAIPVWIVLVPSVVLLVGALVVPFREPLPRGSRLGMLLQVLVAVSLGAVWSLQGASLLAAAMAVLALAGVVIAVRGRA